MVSTVIAASLPVLLIEPVNYYTCKKWLLTKTVDSSISCVDGRDRSIAIILRKDMTQQGVISIHSEGR